MFRYLKAGLAYPADRELDPADIRICRISGYPADIRRSWWSWGASTKASVGRPQGVITANQCRWRRACMEHFRLDSEQVAEQDAARHRQEASDGAHVSEDGDDERVRQVGGGLAGAYR